MSIKTPDDYAPPQTSADRLPEMTSIIFRELEDAIGRTQSLETALKASQGALMRAQMHLEIRQKMKVENERGNIQVHEKAMHALKTEHRAQLNTVGAQVRALEEKLSAANAKNSQLAQQMKAGAAKWDQLVMRVKAQNDKITHFSEQSDAERRRLTQQLNMEKARVSVVKSESTAEIAKLKAEIERLRHRVSAVAAAPVPAKAAPALAAVPKVQTQPTPSRIANLPSNTGTAASTFDRVQKQREQLAEMLRQSQTRLAKDKPASTQQGGARASNVQSINLAQKQSQAPQHVSGVVPPAPSRGTSKTRSY